MSRKLLTGGSKDVKPQILTLSGITQETVNEPTVIQHRLPIVRISTGKKAQIYEFLKVWFFDPTTDATDASEARFMGISTTDTNPATSATIASLYEDTRMIAGAMQFRGVATSGGWAFQVPKEVDLTDGMGNGVLVATDSIYVYTHSAAATTATTGGTVKILYRMFDADVIEYVGIVQSQQ